MPQRLRDLSQAWGELAVRGFEQSAKSVADRNDRDRENLRYIGASVAAGITNKKQKERQDRLRAEENAREDKIRSEQYARQDKRYAVEDARSAEHRQFEMDVFLDRSLDSQEERAIAESKLAATPEQVASTSQALREIRMKREALMSRMAPYVAQRDAETRASEIRATGQPVFGEVDPSDADTLAAAGGPEGVARSMARRGAILRGSNPADNAPYDAARTAAARRGSMGAQGVGSNLAKASIEQPGVASVSAQPTVQLLPEEKAAINYQEQHVSATARYNALTKRAQSLRASKSKARNVLDEANIEKDALAADDAAKTAYEEAGKAAVLARVMSEKAAVRKTEMAKAAESRKAMRDLSIVVKQNGDPRVIGAFLRALKEGASPEAAELIVTGTMKTKDWERAQAAKTPEQEAARKKAEQVALRDQGLTPEGKFPEAAKPVKSPDDEKADAALKKLEGKDAEKIDAIIVNIPTDELGAMFRRDSTSPTMKATIKAELDARRKVMTPEAFNDALYGYRKAKGPTVATPTAPAGAGKIPAPSWVKPEDVPLWDAMTPEEQRARAR